jgi:BirA family biotin operon repressor/biotin-[acetyl-CoA-carboxylase] ligase
MNLIILDEVDSTNRYLKELCLSGDAEYGTVVYCENQKAGYGRRGRNWYASAGESIAVSVALAPFAEDGLVAVAAGVAVVRALRGALVGLDSETAFKIKLPNDVLLNGKKVCGILGERIFGKKEFIVLGIGVNVNNAVFPEELNGLATSLYLETGKLWHLKSLLDEILQQVFDFCDGSCRLDGLEGV